ncbi:hypothetical protein IU427_30050 [Nocardia beijingensis]|uniref:hypothetical protein n=1 Tax=Nocardia beijingensis TaxID=95162 RepID=UPI0018940447|nr:hypothetical protein [Nocardia beijingensis]MBF6469379.1 hypothetical protein [Nocardia beijingensis]
MVRYIRGGIGRADATITIDSSVLDGSPALAFRLDGEIDGVIAFRVEDDRINGLYFVRNPPKLTRVESETPLTLRRRRARRHCRRSSRGLSSHVMSAKRSTSSMRPDTINWSPSATTVSAVA